MKLQVRLHGTREILDAMRQLPQKLDRKLLNKSLLAGALLTRDEARRLAPVLQKPDPRRRAGVLQRAIKAVAVRPERHSATVWVRVRPLTRKQIARFKKKHGKAASDNPNDPYYWRFIEFGTSKLPARPFMRRAFEITKFAAVEAIVNDSRRRVQAEIAKLGRAQRLRNVASRATGLQI